MNSADEVSLCPLTNTTSKRTTKVTIRGYLPTPEDSGELPELGNVVEPYIFSNIERISWRPGHVAIACTLDPATMERTIFYAQGVFLPLKKPLISARIEPAVALLTKISIPSRKCHVAKAHVTAPAEPKPVRNVYCVYAQFKRWTDSST